jgi:predicted metal-dependent hydrolase
MTTIIGACITGGFALIGVIISNWASNRKIENRLDKQQAVTSCQLEELTREVREHNNFARRMPVVEEQIKMLNRRIQELEKAAEK